MIGFCLSTVRLFNVDGRVKVAIMSLNHWVLWRVILTKGPMLFERSRNG